MKKFVLPTKIIEQYVNTGIISVGEIHGVKENSDFYENLVEQLPLKPNLAIEMFNLEKGQFQNFLAGKEMDTSVFSEDGRLTLEYLTFLKKYKETNPEIKILYLDENYAEGELTRDNQMANHFLKNFEKPILLIAGNIHTMKNIFETPHKKIYPMSYFIKNSLGDFPLINICLASGSYFNYGIKSINTVKKIEINKFIEKDNYTYDFYIENVTPATLIR
jgi:uncharacterized iron-regulated protein